MRTSLLAAIAAAALLVSAGCSTQTGPAEDTSPHNESDVSFAEMMIPHHEQAIEMSKLAATRANSAEVKTLAAGIEAAQGPEIQKMQEWLTAWGADGSSHEMSPDEMPGMVDSKTMGNLGKATGAEFDKQFLAAMIAHHEGAVAMAMSEKSDGIHKGAITMAHDIIKTQNAEIKRMQALLAKF